MNYLAEILEFNNRLVLNPLAPSEISLWYALMYANNKSAWQEWFTVSVKTLELLTGMERKTLYRSRNRLKQAGFIDVREGKGNQCASYTIRSLLSRNDTQNGAQSDPQSVSQSGPFMSHKVSPLNKQKLKENSNSNYNSACAREDDPFLSDFDDIEVYYRQNINYSPTQRETQAISKWLSQTCKAGVMYAIDEAVDRGARNKSFISAVVDNLEKSAVKTEEDLELYKAKKAKKKESKSQKQSALNYSQRETTRNEVGTWL